jgi:hypothetical protein
VKNNFNYLRLVILISTFLVLFSPVLTGCTKSPTNTPFTSQPTSSYIPTTTPATSAKIPEKLTVISLVGGSVQVLKAGNSEWVIVEAGVTLEAGDKVKTNAGGNSSIIFFEGSVIDLQNDTVISIVELGINENQSTAIRLKQEIGRTISRVKKLADADDRYEIETPAAVASVRGSSMYVQVDDEGLTIVGNIEGLVAVISEGKEVNLPADTHSRIIPGEAPGIPEPEAIPPTATTTTTLTPPTAPTPTPPPTTSISPTPPPLTVKITNLESGDLVGRTVTVSGVVSDLSITEAVFTLNGSASTISVVYGSFSVTITLADGTNFITVSVTRGGVTATDAIQCVPEEAPS